MKEPSNDLESRMQKISLMTSLLGLGLMILGFVDLLVHRTSLSIPGMIALSPQMIISGPRIPLSLLTMSAGIIVLALLPILRVLLALSLFVRTRQVLNVMVALLVFVELVASVRTGG